MRRLPTRRAVIIALVALVLFLAATTAQAGWLFVLAAGVLGLVVGSFLVRPPLSVAGVERWVPCRVRRDGCIRREGSRRIVGEHRARQEGLAARRLLVRKRAVANGIAGRPREVDSLGRCRVGCDRGAALGRATVVPHFGALVVPLRRASRESAYGGRRGIPRRARLPSRRPATVGALEVVRQSGASGRSRVRGGGREPRRARRGRSRRRRSSRLRLRGDSRSGGLAPPPRGRHA